MLGEPSPELDWTPMMNRGWDSAVAARSQSLFSEPRPASLKCCVGINVPLAEPIRPARASKAGCGDWPAWLPPRTLGSSHRLLILVGKAA